MDSVVFILHEMQQDSLLCGQHCLNNLLQQPIFNFVDLSNIAIELDETEKKMMSVDNLNRVNLGHQVEFGQATVIALFYLFELFL
jgi:hypothetical protein